MARSFLERKGLEQARLEAELLVAHALGLDRLGLFLKLDRPVNSGEIDRARDSLVRRGRREPVAYITGRREFYGREFRVGPGVLIPRPETELLVDLAREWAAARPTDAPAPRVLDLGTGSGCLAITLALELPGAIVTATDVSPAAGRVAIENASRLEADVTFGVGSGLEPLRELGPFDVVVTNPPYVDPEAKGDLEPDVRDYEPPEALFAPPGDPDHWARTLLEQGPALVDPGGILLVELGHDQAPRVQGLARELGREVRLHRDLAGVQRVLEWRG